MSDKNFKKLPFGTEEFSVLRKEDYYYIDKSSYIKKVFENSASVILFTRPRRFGKTLLMNMFKSFLSVAKDGSSDREYKEKLFDGLEILKDKEFIDKYMGQFPVINISLKTLCESTFFESYKKLAKVICDVANEYDFIQDSPNLNNSDKESFKKLLNYEFLRKETSRDYLTSSLNTLSNCLYQYFSKKVIILIDEYDVPLAKASENGYHNEMVALMSSFFNVMKITPSSLSKEEFPIKQIVLTGCLKTVNNSIFTGLNNLYVNTILSENSDYDSMIGFTKEEASQILRDYELEDYFSFVKENYDGYRFNQKEMFCPWVLVSFVKDALINKSQNYKVEAPNYWVNSTSSNALLSYVGYLTDKDNENMQKLMDGECIDTTINDSMNYDDLAMHNAEDFYTLLLFTGYLTVAGYRTENVSGGKPKTIYSLRIPNLEIRECFIQNIKAHFDTVVNQGDNKAKLIANALFDGECTKAKKTINNLLSSYVSIRDFATKAKKENFYHGFLSGVFSNCSDFISDFKSNSESGDGYADLIFKNKDGDTAVILELKTSKSDDDFEQDTNDALLQIEKKKYYEPFVKKVNIETIYCYGISFYNKQCYIACKKINKSECSFVIS